MASKEKETLVAILDELRVFNLRLAAVEAQAEETLSIARGLQTAVSEFHHDVEHKQGEQDQETQRLRERVARLEGKLGHGATTPGS